MRFGLFGSAQAGRSGPDTDSSQGFRNFIDNNAEAEALGYYSTFLVEHHFTGFGQVSASLNLLTWLGARTRHLRLGTAVLVLPWHNPVLLAEQAATLDLLSGGRLDFGVGKGYRYNEFSGFCLPMDEATGVRGVARNHHQGLHLRDAVLLPGQVLAVREHCRRAADRAEAASAVLDGGGSPASVHQVAERGYNMLLGQHSLAEEILDQVAQFRDEVEVRGRPFDPMHVAAARAVHIAKDAADKEAALERRYQGHMRINALARRPDDETRARFKSHEEEARYESAESALFGAPDEIMRKLDALRQGGVEYVIINFGGSRETSAVLPATSSRLSPMGRSRWPWQASDSAVTPLRTRATRASGRAPRSTGLLLSKETGVSPIKERCDNL